MITNTDYKPMHVPEFMHFVEDNLFVGLGGRHSQLIADEVNKELNIFYQKKPSDYSYMFQIKRDRNKLLLFGENHQAPARCDVVVVWLVALPDNITPKKLDKMFSDATYPNIEHTFFLRLNDNDKIYAVDSSFTPQ